MAPFYPRHRVGSQTFFPLPGCGKRVFEMCGGRGGGERGATGPMTIGWRRVSLPPALGALGPKADFSANPAHAACNREPNSCSHASATAAGSLGSRGWVWKSVNPVMKLNDQIRLNRARTESVCSIIKASPPFLKALAELIRALEVPKLMRSLVLLAALIFLDVPGKIVTILITTLRSE